MRKRLNRLAGIFLASSLASFCVWDLQQECASSDHLRAIGDGPQKPEPTNSVSVLVQQGNGGRGREFQSLSDRAHQRTHHQTLKAFRESIGDTWKATVQILVKNRQVALGAIVHPDGWIVSKSSEVPDQLDVKLADGTKAVGVIKSRRQDTDLVLIKIDRQNLASLQFQMNQEIPVGGWLVSTDSRPTPLTIGVLSVANRNVRQEKAVLGVRLGTPPSGTTGAIVESVVDGGGADRAGIEVGDIIQVIDGTKFTSQNAVLNQLRSLQAGQRVDLVVLRDDKELAIKAQMMDLANSLFDSTEMEVNGEISARATGFRNVMQHDTVLLPHQCGGPLVDVEGNVVGLNIARSGRVSSYAFHSRNVLPVLSEMLLATGGPAIKSNDLSAVVQASAAMPATSALPNANSSLPPAVPTSIQVESLKPEVSSPSPM